MKKIILGFISGAILFGTAGTFAVDAWQSINVLPNTIKVIVDGKEVRADNFLYNDTTYLPIRAVSEALGKDVQYDAATSTAVISNTAAAETTPTPTSTISTTKLSDVPIRTVDGIDYIRYTDILTMLKSIGINKYTFGTDCLMNSDTWEIVIADIPLCPTNEHYILADFYYSTIVPYIESH